MRKFQMKDLIVNNIIVYNSKNLFFIFFLEVLAYDIVYRDKRILED